MRRFVRTSSRALPLLAAAALSACASANRPATRVTGAEAIRATLDSAGLLAQEEGPEIRLRAEQDFGNPSNIDAIVRLDDDAYVMVVNVGPDGYARVVFPESAKDDGLLRAGRSYRLPSFFPGFASYTTAAAFGYGARFVPFQRSEYASVMAQGPGFLFAIASSRPMDLQMVEDLGMWDDFRLPQDGLLLDPRYMIQYYRETALGEGKPRGVTAALARYAGWVPGSSRLASATCISPFGYGPRFSSLNWRTGYGFLALPIWAVSAMDYGIGDSYCGYRGLYSPNPFNFNRYGRPPMVVQNPAPVQPPVQPPVDSGATEPGPKPQTRPVGHPRDPLNPPIPGTPVTITDGETIDLSAPGTRRIARQETILSRQRRMIEEAGGPVWMHGAGSGGRPMPRGVEPSGSAGGRNGNSVSLPGRREVIEGAAGSGGSAKPSAPVSAPAPAPAADAPGTRGSGQKPAPPPTL